MSQRKGQEAFNLLYRFYPSIAEQIRGGEFDAFYDDSKLELFYAEVGRLLLVKISEQSDIIGDFE